MASTEGRSTEGRLIANIEHCPTLKDVEVIIEELKTKGVSSFTNLDFTELIHPDDVTNMKDRKETTDLYESMKKAGKYSKDFDHFVVECIEDIKLRNVIQHCCLWKDRALIYHLYNNETLVIHFNVQIPKEKHEQALLAKLQTVQPIDLNAKC